MTAVKARVVSGMRPTGRLHLGHLVGALGNWVPLQDAVRLLLFRRRLARADERLRRYRATSRRTHYENVADWIARGPRSREEHDLRPVARARTRRAVPAAVDGRAGAVARARADLQGTAGEARRTRTSRRSGFSDIRCCRRPTSRCTTRASCRSARIRWRTSNSRAKSCAASTSSSASVLVEPQPLLTHVRAAAGPRRRQEDEQELRQHDRPGGQRGGREEESACGCTRIPKRVRADIPGTVEGNPVFIYHDAFNPEHGRGRGPEGALSRRQGRRRRGEDEAGRAR